MIRMLLLVPTLVLVLVNGLYAEDLGRRAGSFAFRADSRPIELLPAVDPLSSNSRAGMRAWRHTVGRWRRRTRRVSNGARFGLGGQRFRGAGNRAGFLCQHEARLALD